MSRNEDISNAIWDDEEFSGLSPTGKLLYIWSWTNTHCGMAGLYKVTRRRIAWEIGIPEGELAAVIVELEDANMLFYEEGVLWNRSRVKRLRSKSPQMAKSVAKDVAALRGDHPLRVRFLSMYALNPWLKVALENLPGTSVDPMQNRDQYSDVDNPLGTSTEVPLTGKGQGVKGTPTVTVARAPSKAVDQDLPPAELPVALVDAVEDVLAVLIRVQHERGGNLPTRRGVGLAVQAHLDRDHQTVAGELEHWATAGNGARKPVRDWVATYRRFLTNSTPGAPSRTSTGRRASAEDFLAAIGGSR